MLHLVFYARIADEQGAFDVADVLNKVCEKLIHRHPHIYGDAKIDDAEGVKRNWEKLKLKEGKKSVLAGVPASLPALIKAQRIQEKAAKVGFEWQEAGEVWAKVMEEAGELQREVGGPDQQAIEEEFGDLLFALVNYGRFIGVEPESALEKCNRKFKERFEYIERRALETGQSLEEMTLDQMDGYWEEAKRLRIDRD
jgi:XTP/dITP diphosphohydrolase